MKFLEKKIKENLGLLKTIFVIAATVIVISELLSIGKTVSFQQVQTIFSDLPIWKAVIMFIVGLLAILPMTGYDLILNKLLGTSYSKRYIIENSWMINTLNNLAGFGGFISMGLRSEVFGSTKKGKELVSALSKILLFLLSGLSIYSLASLLLLLGESDPYISQYWIWLVGGGLYFPIVYLITRFKKTGLLGGLSARKRWGLIATSFLEWTGVLLTFLCIGYLLGISFTPYKIIPLFIASSIMGIASMIPGSLGSFDVMMLLGLSATGISRELIVVWLLLFRIFYYLIPVLIGLLFLFKNLSRAIDKRYAGIPKQLSLEIAHKIVVVLLYFSGIMMVLLATIPQAFSELHWLQSLNPFRYHALVNFPSILLGFGLLITGRGVAARVSRAYWPTIFLLVIALIYSIAVDFSLLAVIFLVFLLFAVIISKTELYRKQLVYAWEWRTIDGLIFGALTLFYIVIGVYNLPSFPHHHKHFISFFLFPSEKVWLIGLISIFLVALFILLFLHFLYGKREKPEAFFDTDKIQSVLNNFGGNSDSELVFLEDKAVYFYPKETVPTVFLQFSIYNNKCVVMGNPSGKKSDFPAAIEAFINDSDLLGYQPVFYEADEEMIMTLHEFGYDFMKMGEEALVNLETFTTAGKKMKGTRATLNKIMREGYSFEVLSPPYTATQMQVFKAISDSWLDGRREKGFSLGFFSESYLQKTEIAVVKNTAGEIVSFANIIPTYSENIGTIDLMRHHEKKAPSGSMDFLFINLFDYMHSKGIKYFNLGMAPLANVGQSRKSFIQERVAFLIYEFGSKFYSFQGLREYKEKYASLWKPRYTLYPRDSWVSYVMLAILTIDNKAVETTIPQTPQEKFWHRFLLFKK